MRKKHAVGLFSTETLQLKTLFERSTLVFDPFSFVLYEALACNPRSPAHLPLLSPSPTSPPPSRCTITVIATAALPLIWTSTTAAAVPIAALHVQLRSRFSCRYTASWLSPLLLLPPPIYTLSLVTATASTARVEALVNFQQLKQHRGTRASKTLQRLASSTRWGLWP